MLVITPKTGEALDVCVRRYRNKLRQVKMSEQMRKRRSFSKPSEKRRKQLTKARYTEQWRREQG